jgi:lactoylglutathione lyase
MIEVTISRPGTIVDSRFPLSCLRLTSASSPPTSMHAAPPLLNLVVIRSADLDLAERFYRVLGLSFERHRHGTGPEHLAAQPFKGGYVFKIYPASAKSGSTTGVRLGFKVDAVDGYLDHLVEAGGTIIQAPADSEWGRRAVVADPDGHRIELIGQADGGFSRQ